MLFMESNIWNRFFIRIVFHMSAAMLTYYVNNFCF